MALFTGLISKPCGVNPFKLWLPCKRTVFDKFGSNPYMLARHNKEQRALMPGRFGQKHFDQFKRIADNHPSLVDHALLKYLYMRKTASVELRLARKPNCVSRRRFSTPLPAMRPNMREASTL